MRGYQSSKDCDFKTIQEIGATPVAPGGPEPSGSEAWGSERSAETRIATGRAGSIRSERQRTSGRSARCRHRPVPVRQGPFRAAAVQAAYRKRGGERGEGIFVRRRPCEIPLEHFPKYEVLGKCAGPKKNAVRSRKSETNCANICAGKKSPA